MHHAVASRFAHIVPFVFCLALAGVARGDAVYTVSLTNGGLFRFDSSDPYGTITNLTGTGAFQLPSALALGPDGHLYVGDFAFGGRISRYNLTTGSISPVAYLNSGTSGYTGPVWPASIAFRPASQGGQMLVGRSPFVIYYAPSYPQGPVLQIDGWRGNSPVVSDYTTGTAQNYSPGLAVAPDGTLFASNMIYPSALSPAYGSVLAFSGSGAFQDVAVQDGSGSGGLFGPAGLLLSGSTLYTASITTSRLFATTLTGSTVPFGPTVSESSFEVGALAQLSNGNMLAASPGGSGNIYEVSSAASSTLYDSTLATGTAYNLGGEFDLGQIGGVVTMVVPEPMTLALAVCGIAVAAACCRRRRLPVA